MAVESPEPGHGVSPVAPLEVRSEQELAEVARLARRLILRQTTLDREFPDYVYDRASWLKDQNSELAIAAADTSECATRRHLKAELAT
jgi:hypothetical protein